MSQQSMGDGRLFGSHDEWRDYWGKDLLSEMGISEPVLTCAMCGTPTQEVSGFCSKTCETEYERVDG